MRDDGKPDPRDEEADLRQAFAALRREDAENAPSFASLLAGAAEVSRGRRDLRWGVAGLLAAAVLLAAVMVRVAVNRPEPPPAPMASMQEWIAPTAFLLKTPGREILETVPRIGSRLPLTPPQGVAGSPAVPKRRSVSP